MQAQTLYEKLWSSHVVHVEDDGTALIYIDRHLVHEVTSPQAFEGLKLAGRKPWRVDSIVATADHNTPTDHWEQGILDPVSRQQVETLDSNIREVGALAYFPFKNERQGIVHVIGPENGATLPGMTVVCGDSHTSTHGAFACLAHGIGTSEVEHVMATQCLLQKKSRTMLIRVEGELGAGVTAKDIVLAIIGRIGTAGGTGYAMEFAGSAIRGLSMEGRMTICNMAIEAGARAGLVAVDDKTIDYLKDRPFSPKGEQWEQAVDYWRSLHSDEGAEFDKVVELKAEDILPQVTCPVTTYGMSEDAQIRAVDVHAENGQMRFTVQRRNGAALPDLPVVLNLAGEHNVLNALSAIGIAQALNIADDAMLRALAGEHQQAAHAACSCGFHGSATRQA